MPPWDLQFAEPQYLHPPQYSYVCQGCHQASTGNPQRERAEQWAKRHAEVNYRRGNYKCAKRFRFHIEVWMEAHRVRS
ncbi:hypothetical protein GCM10023237_05640 [Streptomyces coeruleoprunus]